MQKSGGTPCCRRPGALRGVSDAGVQTPAEELVRQLPYVAPGQREVRLVGDDPGVERERCLCRAETIARHDRTDVERTGTPSDEGTRNGLDALSSAKNSPGGIVRMPSPVERDESAKRFEDFFGEDVRGGHRGDVVPQPLPEELPGRGRSRGRNSVSKDGTILIDEPDAIGIHVEFSVAGGDGFPERFDAIFLESIVIAGQEDPLSVRKLYRTVPMSGKVRGTQISLEAHVADGQAIAELLANGVERLGTRVVGDDDGKILRGLINQRLKQERQESGLVCRDHDIQGIGNPHKASFVWCRARARILPRYSHIVVSSAATDSLRDGSVHACRLCSPGAAAPEEYLLTNVLPIKVALGEIPGTLGRRFVAMDGKVSRLPCRGRRSLMVRRISMALRLGITVPLAIADRFHGL